MLANDPRNAAHAVSMDGAILTSPCLVHTLVCVLCMSEKWDPSDPAMLLNEGTHAVDVVA